MASLFSDSYSYAMDIDDRLRKDHNVAMDRQLFDKLINVLQYPVTPSGQKKYFDFLNTLSPEALSDRVTQVSALVDVLKNIEKNKRR